MTWLELLCLKNRQGVLIFSTTLLMSQQNYTVIYPIRKEGIVFAVSKTKSNKTLIRTMLICLSQLLQFPCPKPQLYHVQGTWDITNKIA